MSAAKFVIIGAFTLVVGLATIASAVLAYYIFFRVGNSGHILIADARRFGRAIIARLRTKAFAIWSIAIVALVLIAPCSVLIGYSRRIKTPGALLQSTPPAVAAALTPTSRFPAFPATLSPASTSRFPAFPATPSPASTPVTQPAPSIPVAQVTTATPVTQPAPSIPVAQPATAIPVTEPPAATPVSQPATAIPVAQLATATPIPQAAPSLPVAQAATSTPVAQPATAIPVTEPPAATPIPKAATPIPVAQPATATPVAKPVTSIPIAQPVGSTTVSYVGASQAVANAMFPQLPSFFASDYLLVTARDMRPSEQVTFWETFPDQTAHFLATVAANEAGVAVVVIQLFPGPISDQVGQALLGDTALYQIAYPAGVDGRIPTGRHYFSARGDSTQRTASVPFDLLLSQA